MTAALVRQITERETPTPRVNWGRWIVDCQRCSSALTIDPEWGWYDPRTKQFHDREFFRCWDCGSTAEIGWPPDELVYGAERLLLMRPDPMNRNFDPTKETLNELMWENGAHGIFDNLDLLDLHGVSDHLFLSVDEHRIRADKLPAVGQWMQHGLKKEITG